MRIAYSGRARISMRRPRGMGESDRSGFWYNHADLVKQYQWAANKLIDTGLLVGPDEVDVPQDQFRSLILPPDPRPLINPRPSPNITASPIIGQPLPVTPGNLGFTQYVLNAAVPPNYPTTQAGVLAIVASYSGIPTPGGLVFTSVPMSPANTTLTLLPPNPNRAFLLFYNPSQMVAQISLTNATLGALGNIAIGPGEAWFWATAQDLQPVYQGGLTVVSPFGGALPIWVWEDGQGGGLLNDGGWLQLAEPSGWPTDPTVLSVGDLWDNGGQVSVVEGAVPNPLAPPVIFGLISAMSLLALGGANLPLSFIGLAPGQLWNDDGVVSIIGGTGLDSDSGVLILTDGGWPLGTSVPGGFYSNGNICSVAPGGTLNPLATPVYFGQITAAQLLALGGTWLPLTAAPGSGQLYNASGQVQIA